MLEKLKALLFGRETKSAPRCADSDSATDRPRAPPEIQASFARELLKEATKLKKENRLVEACAKLREAYEAPDASFLMIEDRLRLPMYLQLTGKNDEGWAVLNELNVRHVDVFSQAIIANQIRVFLEKEGRFRDALTWAAWAICKELERDRVGKATSQEIAHGTSRSLPAPWVKSWVELTEEAGGDVEFARKLDEALKCNALEEHGYDAGESIFTERIEENTSPAGIASRLQKLLRKAKAQDKAQTLSDALGAYFVRSERFDFREVQLIVATALDAKQDV